VAKDIGTLRTRLSWEDDGANKSMEGFRRDLRGLRSEMNAARSGGREYTNSLKGMRQQSDVLTRRLKTQKEQLRELRRRYRESVRVKGEDAVETKNLASQYNNAEAAMNRTETQLRNLNDEIKRQESPWTKIGESMTKTGDKMQEIGRGMTSFGRDYTMKVTAPIVAGGTAMFKASMDYESAFAGVRKTVDMTEEEFDSLSSGIREMAKELPASATEIAGVAEAAGQLGIQNESIMGFTRTMIDLGVATNMSSEEAATALARLANITGMSQDDFDKLGSTVVDLGNNLATTESEIVEMGLRLAGAGDQIGLTEAQTLAFAGALSSVGIEAEAGGSAFSKVMVNMQLAAERGGDELEEFANVAGMSADDFKTAFEEDASGALIKFIEGLGDVAEDGDTAIGVLDEMGITEVRMRDALLRAAGASDVFTESLEIGTGAWDENIALTEEAEERYGTTESQLKIMWNRIKDVAITLGDALIPAVMDAIDAAEPFIQKIEDGAQAFSEMDEEQQQTILKMIGLVAAIGPASIALGGLTTTAGGFLKAGGGVAKMLGKRGGAGLLGRIGLMGVSAGPVGLAIAGVAALGVTIHALSKDKEELNEVSLETANALQEEYESTGEMIERFDELREKSKLTSDEFGRYIDLQSELQDTTDPDTIEAIKNEMDGLQDKSGMSNDELNEMVGLNGDLTEALPGATEKITDQGNKVAGNTTELEKYNEEIRKMAELEMSNEFYKALENQSILLEQRAEQQGIINDYKEREKEIDELLLNYSEESAEALYDEMVAEQEKITLKLASGDLSKEEIETLNEQKELYGGILVALSEGDQELAEQLIKLKEKRTQQEVNLNQTDQEISKLEMIYNKLQTNYLKNAGISEEKARQAVKDGETISLLDTQLEKLQSQKQELNEQTPAAERNTEEYRNAVGEIDNQIGKLETAKGQIQGLQSDAEVYTDELGKDVDKDVNVKTDPSSSSLDRTLGKEVTKNVKIKTIGAVGAAVAAGAKATPLYAKGTDNHPGGSFIAGEEGQELGRLGNRWEMLNMGMYDRPAGYEVFTHDESKKIISALNRMPAYASGVSRSGETDRVVSGLNSSSGTSGDLQLANAINNLAGRDVVIKIDEREIIRATAPGMSKELDNMNKMGARKNGVVY